MYLQTLSTSDFETEKAEADFCHANMLWLNLLLVINFEERSAIIVANTSSDNLGEREASICVCVQDLRKYCATLNYYY